MDTTVTINGDALVLGSLRVRFMRTLRLPTTKRTYPLPPGLGTFPIERVADHADRVPAEWAQRGGVMLPIHEREAMWLSFSAAVPTALQVGVGKVCAVSGRRWVDRLASRRQNYVVAPTQPWLDGINAGDGYVRQFVATQLGRGWTVEGQVTGAEVHGGIQLRAVPLNARRRQQWLREQEAQRLRTPAHFGDHTMPPPAPTMAGAVADAVVAPPAAPPAARSMGMGAGGRMRQKIYPDPHGRSAWDEDAASRVFVHLVAAADWEELTGRPAPTTPPTAHTYAQYGLPWFDLDDAGAGDVAASDELAHVTPLDELMNVDEDDVVVGPTVHLGHQSDHGTSTHVPDGTW